MTEAPRIVTYVRLDLRPYNPSIDGPSPYCRRAKEKELKMIRILLAATFVLASSAAHAGSYYDGYGRYQGYSHDNGNSTSYYDNYGRYQGYSHDNGNSTSYYGNYGRYQGYQSR